MPSPRDLTRLRLCLAGLLLVAVALVGWAVPGSWSAMDIEKPDEPRLGKATLCDLGEESKYEKEGMRVSVRAMKWSGRDLQVLYRVELTTQPPSWFVDHNPISVHALFWDRCGEKIRQESSARLLFAREFAEGEKRINDSWLSFHVPDRGETIAVKLGHHVTKKLKIRLPR
jgi:hypothetical protein